MRKVLNSAINGFGFSIRHQNGADLFNRISLFVVFFWFGFLKLLSISPAETLIQKLYSKTINGFISFDHFIFLFGILECTIGVFFLFPKYTKIAFILFSFQMVTTFLPMVFLPNEVWQNGIALTLTGQYIMKNFVLVACAYTIWKSNQLNSK